MCPVTGKRRMSDIEKVSYLEDLSTQANRKLREKGDYNNQ